MLVDPETTWLLVSTSPVEVRMMPVPAAAPDPLADWMTVFTSTTNGSPLAAIAVALGEPADGAGVCGTVAIGLCSDVVETAWVCARLQPMARPPTSPIRQIARAIVAIRRVAPSPPAG